MKNEFISLFDREVDGLFNYCYEITDNKRLSYSIIAKAFERQWDLITEGYPLSSVRKNLYSLVSQFITEETYGSMPTVSELKTRNILRPA